MKITHGIIAYTIEDKEHPKMKIFHFVGFESPLTNDDFLGITQELNTDPEFGLVGRIGDDVFLMEASKEMVAEMAAQVGEIPESEFESN